MMNIEEIKENTNDIAEITKLLDKFQSVDNLLYCSITLNITRKATFYVIKEALGIALNKSLKKLKKEVDEELKAKEGEE